MQLGILVSRILQKRANVWGIFVNGTPDRIRVMVSSKLRFSSPSQSPREGFGLTHSPKPFNHALLPLLRHPNNPRKHHTRIPISFPIQGCVRHIRSDKTRTCPPIRNRRHTQLYQTPPSTVLLRRFVRPSCRTSRF